MGWFFLGRTLRGELALYLEDDEPNALDASAAGETSRSIDTDLEVRNTLLLQYS